MSCNMLVRSITFQLVELESPNLVLRCIYRIGNLVLIFQGQGQRSRSPEVKRSKTLIGHISKTTGPIHSKHKPKCTARDFFPYASFWNSTSGLKARQRSKVKYAFLTITQKLLIVSTWNKDHWIPLDEPHKNAVTLFFVRWTVFEIFAILRFSDLDEIHIFDHNSKIICRSDLK